MSTTARTQHMFMEKHGKKSALLRRLHDAYETPRPRVAWFRDLPYSRWYQLSRASRKRQVLAQTDHDWGSSAHGATRERQHVPFSCERGRASILCARSELPRRHHSQRSIGHCIASIDCGLFVDKRSRPCSPRQPPADRLPPDLVGRRTRKSVDRSPMEKVALSQYE